MNLRMSKTAAVLAVGFVAGFGASTIAGVLAHPREDVASLENRRFGVTILEVKQSLGSDTFRGGYRRTVTLSNGQRHDIELRPVMFPGLPTPSLKFLDNGEVVTNIGAGGSSRLDDGLMVSVLDLGGDQAVAR